MKTWCRGRLVDWKVLAKDWLQQFSLSNLSQYMEGFEVHSRRRGEQMCSHSGFGWQ